MEKIFTDEYFMKAALREAEIAFKKDEVPVGAVVVYNNKIIARGHNLVEALNDPTAHAEMQAITAASDYLGGKYLSDCTIYVSLEPCLMCAGALFWAQAGAIVYGASDPKRGFSRVSAQITHPKTEIRSGIMKAECSSLLKEFFEARR